jgi:hypothetical protein
MIIEKLVYDVREQLRQFSDDSDIDDRYILHLFSLKRAKYLRQDLNNFQKTTDVSVTQTICMETEVVSANECGLDYDCETILRTVDKVPTPLELHLKSAIIAVKPTTRLAVPFNFVTKQKAVYSQFSPYNSSIYAFLDNDMHIYIVSKSTEINLIECISVTGVFEDPLDMMNFKTCCGCDDAKPCFDIYTTNYPLQPHYIDLIKAEIIRELTISINTPQDKENDADEEQENRRQN